MDHGSIERTMDALHEGVYIAIQMRCDRMHSDTDDLGLGFQMMPRAIPRSTAAQKADALQRSEPPELFRCRTRRGGRSLEPLVMGGKRASHGIQYGPLDSMKCNTLRDSSRRRPAP
jgi:hypothetical protein